MEQWLANRKSLDFRRFMAGLLVAAIVVGSISVAFLVAIKHERDHQDDQRAEVRRVAIALERISSVAVTQLRSAAAFLELRPNLGQAAFGSLIDTLVAEHPVASVSYLEATTRADRKAAGETVLRDGRTVFHVRLSSADTPEGNLRPAGAAAAKHLADVLGRARDSGSPAISRAVQLWGSDDRHLVLFHPVGPGGGDSTADRAEPPGVVAGVLRISDLLAAAAAITTEGTRLALVGSGGEPLVEDPELENYAASPVTIADRRWELRLVMPQSQVWVLPLAVGLAGLVLAAMTGLLLFNWARRERGMLTLAQTRIEQRDRAMKAEAETNRMYRLLAENLTDMVMVTGPEGLITFVSPAGKQMLGWAPEEMIGQPILSFLYSDDEDDAREHLASLREAAGIHTFEHRLRCRDGSFVWVESAVRSIFDRASERVVEFQSTTRDISERKPLQDQLERLAREDPLTGLSNRRQFNEMLARELARALRSGEACAAFLIDIDHFKPVNDSYGHLTGDRVLRRVAEALKSRMRLSDTVARLGGDEFAAILPEVGAEQAESVAAKIIEAVHVAFGSDSDLPVVTVSIGIAIFECDPDGTTEHLLERADLALYAAKAAGRDRFRLYGHEVKAVGRP